MIFTKFCLYLNVNDPEGVTLERVYLPQVPDRGEVINIDDNRYTIVDRSWALDNGSQDCPDCPDCRLYCFVKVIKAGDFKVKLGDKEY